MSKAYYTNTHKKLEKLLNISNIDLYGKTVALSGSTGGLGRTLCFRLAALGASLILIDRNKSRSLSLAEELRSAFPSIDIKHITLDLEDPEQTSAVADELCADAPDFLILNAGAYSIPRRTCSNGFDNVFTINFFSPYILIQKLLGKISEKNGKIIIVGSIAHRYSSTDESDIDFSTRKRASRVYGNAKRYLMYAADAEKKYRKNIAITHPGITVTNITSHYPKVIYALIKYPMKLIFSSPENACFSIICGLFSETSSGEWTGPQLFDVWGKPKLKSFEPKPEEQERVRFTADLITQKYTETKV